LLYNDGVTATRAIIYCRVSTEEQGESGAGLAAQEQAARGECARRGWDVVRVAEEVASAASVARRPKLREAIEALERGEADVLVVAKLDRLARSILDFVTLMARSKGRGWALLALDLQIDTTTASGKLFAHILASFAEFERDLIGQRTREALAERRRQGVRLGRPRTLSPGVRAQIVEARREGMTLRGIADALNDAGVSTAQGGKRWYPSTVRAAIGVPEAD
jgi:DNA invertase Pin-like site-specific DNA recombinase